VPEALVHDHCHQKAFGAMKSTRKVMGRPDFSFDVVECALSRDGSNMAAAGEPGISRSCCRDALA
jgi:hypothetical protein